MVHPDIFGLASKRRQLVSRSKYLIGTGRINSDLAVLTPPVTIGVITLSLPGKNAGPIAMLPVKYMFEPLGCQDCANAEDAPNRTRESAAIHFECIKSF